MNLFSFVYLLIFINNALSLQERVDITLTSKSVGNNLFYKSYTYWPYFPQDISASLIQQVEEATKLFHVESKVTFYLYNKKSPNSRQQLFINDTELLKNSNWIAGLPTKMFIHGYVANSTVPQMETMKNKFLERNEDLNVIALDWGPIANMFYIFAAHYTEDVGIIGSKFIDFLCTNGAKTSDFHVIGLSLGAHVAGFVANNVKAGRISRVTGLDPAFLGFLTEDNIGRLDKSDADFVDCIHTTGGLVGFMKPLCHADFYPNGGKHPQPGCANSLQGIGCSHVRAQDLFTESIEAGHIFLALTCQQFTNNGLVNCIDQGALMGYAAQKIFQGLFYVETGSKYPFALA